MVASRQVEIPYYRAVGRQRGRGFGSLAQVIGRTAIPFLRKYVVPAAKRIGADMLEFAVPEIAEVVSGRKNFKTAAKSVGKKTLRKQLGEGEGQGQGSRRREPQAYGRTGSRRKGTVGGRELAYGRQASRKQRRIIPTKSTKQSSRSRRDIFTKIPH